MKIKKKAPIAGKRRRPAAPAPARSEAETIPTEPARSLVDVLPADAIAYAFWQQWQRARERGDYALIRQMVAVGSPIDAKFGPVKEFADTVRQRLRPLPGFDGGSLERVRLEGSSEAHLLVRLDAERRGLPEVVVERFFLLRHEEGWRCHSIDRQRVPADANLATLGPETWPTVPRPEGFDALVQQRTEDERKARAEAAAERRRRIEEAAAAAEAGEAVDATSGDDSL